MLSHPLRRFIAALSLLAGAAARRSLAHGFDHNSHCPAINCFRGSVGDPHLQFAGGGKADFRGRNGTVYSFLSAPRLQVNVLTEARTFKRAHTATKRQLVHGSFITRAFIRLNATLPGGKIALVRIAILAEQYDTFRDYRTDDLPSFFLHTPQARYYNKTRIEVGDVAVMQLSGGRTFVRGAGWQFTIHRRRLMKPVVEGSADAVAPSAGWTRLHWFLDTKFDVLDNNPTSSPRMAARPSARSRRTDHRTELRRLDDRGQRQARRLRRRARVYDVGAGRGRHRGHGRRLHRAFALLDGLSLLALQRHQPRRAAQREPARGRQGRRRHVSLGRFDTALRRGDGARRPLQPPSSDGGSRWRARARRRRQRRLRRRRQCCGEVQY